MKLIHFIWFLFKHGSLKSKPINFDQRDAEILKGLSASETIKHQSFYVRLRNKLVRNAYTGSLVYNLAYLKSIPTVNKQFFIVDILQLCYVRIFKAASTSMLREILPLINSDFKNKNLNDRQVDVLANTYAKSSLHTKQKDYTRFTIIRNPFHRLVSVYLDLFHIENHFFGYQSYLFGIFKPGMSFTEFVTVLYQIPDVLKSQHFTSQYKIVRSCGGLEHVTYFRLEKDIAALNTFLNTYSLKLSEHNKHQVLYDYRDYYSAETLRMANIMYGDDVEKFDYREEYELLKQHVIVKET